MGKDCCPTWLGIITLIVGIMFLLEDFGTWGFLGINWWTAMFILIGVCSLSSLGKGKK